MFSEFTQCNDVSDLTSHTAEPFVIFGTNRLNSCRDWILKQTVCESEQRGTTGQVANGGRSLAVRGRRFNTQKRRCGSCRVGRTGSWQMDCDSKGEPGGAGNTCVPLIQILSAPLLVSQRSPLNQKDFIESGASSLMATKSQTGQMCHWYTDCSIPLSCCRSDITSDSSLTALGGILNPACRLAARSNQRANPHRLTFCWKIYGAGW